MAQATYPPAYTYWRTYAPPGVSIDYAITPSDPWVDCTIANDGYQAAYESNGFQESIADTEGGKCNHSDHLDYGTAIWQAIPASGWFGWGVECVEGPCSQRPYLLIISGIQLGATETGPPHLTPSGDLYAANGSWIRGGGWSLAAAANDPTGVCVMRAVINGGIVNGWSITPDEHVWNQCNVGAGANYGAVQTWNGPSVNTANFADGTTLNLSYQAHNATTDGSGNFTSSNWAGSPTSTTYVDNSPVQLTLTGPTDAPDTAGPQYVTATATSGPSGVGSIDCSVDGGPSTAASITGGGTHTATARVGVNGLGIHTVKCDATNRAVDVSGHAASSQSRSWTVHIGEPVQSGISFARVIRDCRRVVRTRVVTPARWIKVRRHHRWLRIHVAARKRREHVLICSTRGRAIRAQRVRFGHGTRVSGWFATADGSALAHVGVRVVAAADDGSGHWRTIAEALTRADGSWSAAIKPGPSRSIQAIYGGGPLTEAATSPTVRTIVPARVRITIHPTHVRWGHRVVISGRVFGGFVPRRSQLLQLRVGLGHIGSVQGNPSIDSRTGRFRFIWQFHTGTGRLSPWFAVATLREADYPYAPAVSRRVVVKLG